MSAWLLNWHGEYSPHAPHFVWFAAPRGGLLRLRSGEASPAAPAGEEVPCTRVPTFVIGSEARQSTTTLALRLRLNKASPAASAGGEAPCTRVPTFVIASEARQSMTALALRLHFSKASPAAPAGLKKGMLLPLPCPHCSFPRWGKAGMGGLPELSCGPFFHPLAACPHPS